MTAVRRDKRQKDSPPAQADGRKTPLRAKPRPVDVEAACDDVMARYANVLARLAE